MPADPTSTDPTSIDPTLIEAARRRTERPRAALTAAPRGRWGGAG